jgi:trans-2,3-dihydro-3-hydroxyanthranilate isomerase
MQAGAVCTLGPVGAFFDGGFAWDNAGRVEDVATGSVAGPAAGYLLHHGVRPTGQPVLVHQGRFTGRPSTIEVRPGLDGRLWVGGARHCPAF